MPLVIVFSFYLLTNTHLRQYILKDDVIFRNRHYSAFTKFLILATGRIIQTSTHLTCLVNFHKRDKVLNLIRRIYETKLSEKCAINLKLQWIRLFSIMLSIILIVTITAFTSKMKPSYLSLICHIITSIPYQIISGYLIFLKAFEIFFISLLKDFRQTLDWSDLTLKDYEVLAVKYRKILEMNKDFLKVFGSQISIIITCIIAVVIFQVLNFLKTKLQNC